MDFGGFWWILVVHGGTWWYMVVHGGTWCPPCKALIPVLEQLQNINIIKADIDESPDLFSKYNISGLPTIVFFKDGLEVSRLFGLTTK